MNDFAVLEPVRQGRKHYEYISEIQETDFGKISVLEIKTDDKLQIESVVIE